MTREEWYSLHRQRRIESKTHRPILNCASLTNALKEYYGHILYGKDAVKEELILRYRDKASPQLLYDLKKLKEKGKRQADQLMRDLINRPNPLLKMISEQSRFIGRTLPHPNEMK